MRWGWFAFFAFFCLFGLDSKQKDIRIMSFILVLVFGAVAAFLAYSGK